MRVKIFRNLLYIIIGGLIYLLIVKYTPFGLRCPIHALTGLNCPACGTTRMALAITRMDFSSAFRYNGFMFITAPYLFVEVQYLLYKMETGEELNKVNKIVLYVWVGLLVLFGIFRNIYSI